MYPLKSYGWVLVNYRIHSGLFVRFSIKFEFFQRYLMILSVRPGTWAWQKCFQSQKQLNSTFANICSLLCLSVIKTPQTAENQLFHISTIIEWVIIEFFIIYIQMKLKIYDYLHWVFDLSSLVVKPLSKVQSSPVEILSYIIIPTAHHHHYHKLFKMKIWIFRNWINSYSKQ